MEKLTGTMQESHEAWKDPRDIEYTFISPQKGLKNRSNYSHGEPMRREILKIRLLVVVLIKWICTSCK